MTSTREPNPVKVRGMELSNPMLSREVLIINMYSLLQSVCREKFISMAGTAVMAVFPNFGRDRVKRHRVLSIKYQMIKFIDFCEVWFLPESVARVAAIVGDHRCHSCDRPHRPFVPSCIQRSHIYITVG
ncbi:hypothetical protein TNCV_4150901 [Trichonephila clavipes]|nr:hypothetical protein TNCV_4150901 [Trichonephila clavipes]